MWVVSIGFKFRRLQEHIGCSSLPTVSLVFPVELSFRRFPLTNNSNVLRSIPQFDLLEIEFIPVIRNLEPKIILRNIRCYFSTERWRWRLFKYCKEFQGTQHNYNGQRTEAIAAHKSTIYRTTVPLPASGPWSEVCSNDYFLGPVF